MRKHRKKVLFLSPYPVNKAPSQRLKFEQYYPYFEEAGYDITTSSFVDDDFWKIIYKKGNFLMKGWYTFKGYIRRIKDLWNLGKYDIVYVHLWVTPLGAPLFERLVARLAKNLIYDIDDLVYLGETTKSNQIIKHIKGRNKPISLMKRAKHVIVCTPKLDEFVKQYNKSTTDISSTIDTDKYIPKIHYNFKGKPVLGWSGSHSTSKYLYLLKDSLLELRKHVDFKLLVIGDPNFSIDGLDIEAIPWQAKTEVESLSRIDIGLYPLPNEEWVYGKSGLKALQYMALGIPTLATAIGANFRVLEDNKSGFLIPVDNSSEWVERIMRLLKDNELRKFIGVNGRRRVVDFYSIKTNKKIYLDIFNSLCIP